MRTRPKQIKRLNCTCNLDEIQHLPKFQLNHKLIVRFPLGNKKITKQKQKQLTQLFNLIIQTKTSHTN